MSQKYIILYISLYKLNRSKSNQSKIAPLVQLLTHGHQISIKYWYLFKTKFLLPHIPRFQVCSIFSIVPAPDTNPTKPSPSLAIPFVFLYVHLFVEYCKKHVLCLQNNLKEPFEFLFQCCRKQNFWLR